jgi:hypothetical protein
MAASREAAASRPSIGGGVEAEHWVEGEEGGVEGGVGVSVGVEANKRRRRRRRGWD